MTEEEIKAGCEMLFQNGGSHVYAVNPARRSFRPSLSSAKLEAQLAWRGEQVWARRKVRGTSRWEWQRVTTGEEQVMPSDSAMLDWLCQGGRYVSHSRDGEFCNVWCANPVEGAAQRTVPVEGFPQKSYRTPREAIAAAMKVQP